ncbi:MAG TPA: M48 family metallopeptidase [Bacteroidales bacterium]|nr:M48 family metallopeptidase [Bacteroidales bacterium]
MNTTVIYLFYAFLAILILSFAAERILDWLNIRNWPKVLPDLIRDIFPEEKFMEVRQYQLVNYKVGFIEATITSIITIGFLYFGGFAWLDGVARSFSSNLIVQSLIFFGIIAVATFIIRLPFDIYDTFVIESRFGFNTTTPRIYITDQLKSALLTILIGVPLFSLIVFLYQKTGEYFWVLVWLVISIFALFMSLFYSSLIVPLFNKQTPIPEGELRTAIEEFAHKAGFKVKDIYVIDSSKRSSKANAYFTGLGPEKRIVLYDTLIKDFSIDEILAVLAHEIGHYKHHHTTIGLITSIVQTGLILFVFSLFVKPGSELTEVLCNAAAGARQVTPSFYMGLIGFTLLFSPISAIIGLIFNSISRRHEFQADAYVAEHQMQGYLQSALKKLSVNHLSNPFPHPLYVKVYYSHPPLIERLKALENTSRREPQGNGF